MNPAHLHLFLTHVPVFGTLFGGLLLLLGVFRKSEDLKRLSLLIFVLSAILVIPTYLTGSPATAYMKKLFPTTPMDTAEQHEEIAILALVAVLFLGLLAASGRVMFKGDKGLPNWFVSLVLALTLLTTGALTWTANLGGKIRHTEIRNESPAGVSSEH